MPSDNFDRMMAIADMVFSAHNDPDQLRVDQNVIEKLLELHPSTVSELDEGDGPCIWILMIPTTLENMHDFLACKISERELFGKTAKGQQFAAVYLCSAMTLTEYRGKGITKKLALEAIGEIQKKHEITTLYVWAFTPEGRQLAGSIAKEARLPLLERRLKEKTPDEKTTGAIH